MNKKLIFTFSVYLGIVVALMGFAIKNFNRDKAAYRAAHEEDVLLSIVREDMEDLPHCYCESGYWSKYSINKLSGDDIYYCHGCGSYVEPVWDEEIQDFRRLTFIDMDEVAERVNP